MTNYMLFISIGKKFISDKSKRWIAIYFHPLSNLLVKGILQKSGNGKNARYILMSRWTSRQLFRVLLKTNPVHINYKYYGNLRFYLHFDNAFYIFRFGCRIIHQLKYKICSYHYVGIEFERVFDSGIQSCWTFLLIGMLCSSPANLKSKEFCPKLKVITL